MEKKPVKRWQVILPGCLTLAWLILALRDFSTGADTVSRILSVFCLLCWLTAVVCSLIEYKKQK